FSRGQFLLNPRPKSSRLAPRDAAAARRACELLLTVRSRTRSWVHNNHTHSSGRRSCNTAHSTGSYSCKAVRSNVGGTAHNSPASRANRGPYDPRDANRDGANHDGRPWLDSGIRPARPLPVNLRPRQESNVSLLAP